MNANHCSPGALAVIAVAVAGAPAAAQSDAEIAAAGRACLAIDRDDRLACFERAFGPAESQPSPAAAPAARRAEPAARAAPEPAASPRGPQQLRIVATREIRPGDVRFETADGALYYHNGSSTRRLAIPETPFMATLESGALGSRFLRFGPDSTQRVRVSERD
jgi:hypothetical protein